MDQLESLREKARKAEVTGTRRQFISKTSPTSCGCDEEALHSSYPLDRDPRAGSIFFAWDGQTNPTASKGPLVPGVLRLFGVGITNITEPKATQLSHQTPESGVTGVC